MTEQEAPAVENRVVYIITKNGKEYQRTFSADALKDILEGLAGSRETRKSSRIGPSKPNANG